MKFKKILPIIYIFVISIIFFSPYFFGGKVPLPADALVGAHIPWVEIAWEDYPSGVPIKNLEKTDAISQFYPWRKLVGEFWRSGHVPLWNHYMFSGTPFLATWHSAGLYPFNVLYLFFSDIDAWSLLIYLQILLSGIFTYLFLKELNLSNSACLFGAIAFSYSGYMVAWLAFATGGHAGLWLPFLLWSTHRYANKQNFLYVFLISVGFFFVYTAGDFQVPLYVSIIYITYIAYLWAVKLKIFLKLMLAFILGVFLSLPQILPVLELYPKSIRYNDPYISQYIAEYSYGLMPWGKVTNFIWPDFYGNVVTRNYWGGFGFNFHEYMSFFGVTTLIFLIVGLTRQSSIRYEKYFRYGLIFSLIMLFPTPFAYLPYILEIPGLGTSFASRILFVVGFFASVIAASQFSRMKDNLNFIAKICLILLAATFIVGFVVYLAPHFYDYGIGFFTDEPAKIKVSLKNMIPGTAIVISIFLTVFLAKKFDRLDYIKYFLLLFLTLEILWYATKNTSFSPRKFVFPDTKITEFLQTKSKDEQFRIAGGIPLNLFMLFGLQSVEGYDSIYPKINSEWYSVVNSKDLNALSGRYGVVHDFSSPLLAYSNMKYLIDYPKNRFGGMDAEGVLYSGNNGHNYKKVFEDGRIAVYEALNYLPRVWLSNKIYFANDKEDLILQILNTDSVAIFLEEDPKFVSSDDPEYVVKNYSLGKNKISFDIETTKDAYVFHSVSYDNSWELYINQKKTNLFKANLIFQSFKVDAGENRIEMFYRPKVFRYSFLFSVVTFLVLFFITIGNNLIKAK